MSKIKQTNKKLIISLFASIETDLGYHIKDYTFNSECTMCDFHIKELPKYKFGVWNVKVFGSIKKYSTRKEKVLWFDSLQIPSVSELVFFTQYEDAIDKFKPSMSGMVCGLRRDIEDNKITTNWNLEELKSILGYMKYHKYKTYYNVYYNNNYIWRSASGWYCFLLYYSHKFQRSKYNREQKKQYKKSMKKALKFVKKLKNVNYYIFDFSKNMTPGINIFLRHKLQTTETEVNSNIELFNILEKSYDPNINTVWLDKYFLYGYTEAVRMKIQEDKMYNKFNALSTLTEEDPTVKLITTNIKN